MVVIESDPTRQERPYREALAKLRASKLRPTRQRLALACLLFDGIERHVTAEGLHSDALRHGVRVSLATIYNTLHQFTHAGLLRQVVVDGARTYFDTNIGDHHHFYFEDSGELKDIPGASINVTGLPLMPEGYDQRRIEVIIRVAKPVR